MDEMMTEPVALKSITIEAQEDGTFMVGTKPEVSEMPEEGMEDMAMDEASGMQPAGSIDEALDLARQMLQEGGMTDEESMMAGYNKAKPQGMSKPSPAKVFGEM